MNMPHTPHEMRLYLNQLISDNQVEQFKEIMNNPDNKDLLNASELTYVFIKACELGHVAIVDFLFSCSFSSLINFDFPYIERDPPYQEEVKNGAIFLAGDHHVELLEYFIKHDIYYIDHDTQEALKTYMPSVLDIIDKIEHRLYLSEKLSTTEPVLSPTKRKI